MLRLGGRRLHRDLYLTAVAGSEAAERDVYVRAIRGHIATACGADVLDSFGEYEVGLDSIERKICVIRNLQGIDQFRSGKNGLRGGQLSVEAPSNIRLSHCHLIQKRWSPGCRRRDHA